MAQNRVQALVLLLVLCISLPGKSGSASVREGGGQAHSECQKRCDEGLELHGRGRWKQALVEFAATVVEFGVQETMDCIYGAGLSLNTLGDIKVRSIMLTVCHRPL